MNLIWSSRAEGYARPLTSLSSPDPGLWRGVLVAVTGGEGFLGAALVSLLHELGARVRVVRHADHDLRIEADAREAVSGAEVVFHLAARVGGIGFNSRHPALLARDNLLLGVNVFEQARLANVRRLVAVSSVCAYPESPPLPFREQDLWNGYPEPSNASYGVAKRVLLTLSEAYWAEHRFSSCTPILTNLYGPGAPDDLEDSHVIPALIRKFLSAQRQGEPVVVWGTGSATRDFLFVDDAARALVLAAERLNEPCSVNIGSGVERSIAQVVELIAKLLDFRGEVIWDGSRPDGQRQRRLDLTRAADLLGFEARVDLSEGLSRTIGALDRSSPGTQTIRA